MNTNKLHTVSLSSFIENSIKNSENKTIQNYIDYRKGIIQLYEDAANSLLMEIICDMADEALEKEFGIPVEDMCNEEGSFYEKYQDRFNDLYDDIEEQLLIYDFITE